MLKGERDQVLRSLERGDSWSEVDPFSDDDLDSANVLGRIGPGLRQHLGVKGRKSELVVFAVLRRIWPCVSVGSFQRTCMHAYESTYL